VNATSQARLAQVHPDLQRIIPNLCAQFDAKFPGWNLEVTQGLRSYPEQAALYAQGRMNTNSVNELRAVVNWAPITVAQNNIVTNAAAGYGWHNFGCAVDVAPESTTGIDWDGSDDHWEFIVETGEALGLHSGISWHDEPHFQLQDIPVSPDDETRYLFAENGIAGVWNEIGDAPPTTQDA
jgi:peptidoglycan L-alanyl-D-glutamate endopeptidase CwlK